MDNINIKNIFIKNDQIIKNNHNKNDDELFMEEFNTYNLTSKNKLIDLVKKLKAQNPKIDISYEMIDTNTIADNIVNIAKKTNTDLIIMGSHGRKGIDRILMGSFAESVLRHAECNVMIYKTTNV